MSASSNSQIETILTKFENNQMDLETFFANLKKEINFNSDEPSRRSLTFEEVSIFNNFLI